MPTAFSEITAAAALLRGILGGEPPAPAPAAPPAAPHQAAPLPALDAGPSTHAGLIERELDAACRRLGAAGGVVSDHDGFAVASVRPGPDGDAAPVTAAVLGAAVEHAQRILGGTGEPQAILSLAGAERLALRRFDVDGKPFNLLLIFAPGAAVPASLTGATEALARVLEAEPSSWERGP